MDILYLALLAIIQGVTEFLPVSSSGHLVLVPFFMGTSDHMLVIDVAVHVGTLGAVMLYLWRDIFRMVGGLGRLAKGQTDPGARLVGLLIIGSLPVIAAGFVINHLYPDGIRDIKVIGWATVFFGMLLLMTDQLGMTLRRIEHLRNGDAIIIGIAQVFALIPGASRSGLCMTAGRMMGMERVEAARFAMLLGVPAILGAGLLKGYELWKLGDSKLVADAVLAAGLSLGAALISISLMMAWLRRANFTVFAIYRLFLGGFLLMLAYGFN